MVKQIKIGNNEYECPSEFSANLTEYIRQLLIEFCLHLHSTLSRATLSRDQAEMIVDEWLNETGEDFQPIPPVVHYAPYGRNLNGLYECGHSTGGYTGEPIRVTCDKCKKLSPGLWPELVDKP